jgi:hypothetical protein
MHKHLYLRHKDAKIHCIQPNNVEKENHLSACAAHQHLLDRQQATTRPALSADPRNL